MPSKVIRYAVVGLGYFGQAAVLPAFKRARGVKLQAIVSDDGEKLRRLGETYDVPVRTSYDDYDALLAGGDVDAVYIALPNTMHADFTQRAARVGVHVLCEKPMAMDEVSCQQMIDATQKAGVKLMIGYRLHFDAPNLALIDAIQAGEIGDPRFFHASFAMQVQPDNIRLKQELGGGPLWDIGIYCINAARYAFQSEPIEVAAAAERRNDDPRFLQVDEQISGLLRFPDARLATFTASFGAAHVARYEVIGTEGWIRLDPAFDLSQGYVLERETNGKRKRKTYAKRDQVAAELEYFARCIREGREPEPSGAEGLADVRIMRALEASALANHMTPIERSTKRHRPSGEQEIRRPSHDMPELIHAEPPSG